jgi:CubicO group peptidase (beta-lactamase class C family)
MMEPIPARKAPMRRALCVLVVAVVMIVHVPVRAEDLRYDRFGEYLESLRTQAGIPGLAAALVGRTDIVWEGAFGQQDIERAIAVRTDTPFHLDGTTQTVAAAILLRCVEEGRLSLSEPIGRYRPNAPEPNATIQQLLTHTTATAGGLSFAYAPDRLAPLSAVIRACSVDSYRETMGTLLERLAMINSVPGADITRLVPPAEGIPSPDESARYASVLTRLARPYAVDRRGRAVVSQYAVDTLTPAAGLIASVRDLAQFDVALRRGMLLRDSTLSAAWTAPTGATGQTLPHGIGWFVQSYKGERVVWQFGVSENGGSSMLVTIPGRATSMILLANSDGLARSFDLAAGDVTLSPFARMFLGLFVR